jgi:hypothetical protein
MVAMKRSQRTQLFVSNMDAASELFAASASRQVLSCVGEGSGLRSTVCAVHGINNAVLFGGALLAFVHDALNHWRNDEAH